jgi:hypothetical protein
MTSGGVTFKWPNFDDIERNPRADGGVDIVLDGEIIDTIEPVKHLPTPEENEAHLRRYREIVQLISEQIGDTPVDAVELVRAQRRNLTPDEWVAVDENGEL